MLHFIIGGAGTGKSTRLMQEVKQLLSREPDCIILVPEQFSYEFDKKLYHFIGAQAFNQLETHSFTSLSRMLFQKYGKYTAEYADNITRKALLLQAVQTVRQKQGLQFFDRQCMKTDFMNSMEQLLSVLRRNGTTAAVLYETAMTCTGRLRDKLQDIAAIAQQYETLLEVHQLQDALTDITEAAAIANLHDFFLGKTILIDEFESFTEDEYAMLQVMVATAADIFITLRTEENATAEDTLFATVQDTRYRMQQLANTYHIASEVQVCHTAVRFSSADLAYLSQSVFRTGKTQATQPASHVHIFEARDAVSELEYVCATIRRCLMQDSNLHCSDIAILTNDLSSYTPIVNHAFARYDLPFYLDTADSILHHPFSVYLLTLLELVQQRNLRTEYLLRYAKTGFTGCDWLMISQLENYCYQWNIKGKTWESPFPQPENETMRTETEQAEAARQVLVTPLLRLRKDFSACKTGADYCNALYQHVQQNGISDRLTAFCQTEDDTKTISMQQDAKYIWGQFIAILDCLYTLYADVALSLSDFCLSLSYLFQGITYATPPRTLDAVLIGQTGRSRLRDPKMVFVIHCSEGAFPATALAADLFSEREYRLMEEKQIVIRKELQKILADERLAVYKTLSSASQELYLTYPLVDTGNQKSYPSFVLSQIQALFPNGTALLQTEQQIPMRYYATTPQSAYYHYVRNFSERSTEIAAVQCVLQKRPDYQQKIAYLQTVHDHLSFQITDPTIMERLMGKQITMTASKLETYQLCPFQFFCNSALQLYQRQKIQLDPARQGSLVHFCLEQVLRRYPREEFLSLTEEELLRLVEELTLQFWTEMLGGDFSKEPRALAVYESVRKQLHITLLHVQEELRQTLFYPKYLELPIRWSNPDFRPLKAVIAGGHSLQIEGIVDRVDVCEVNGKTCVRIIDYKSGTKEFSLGNLQYGLDMQMLIYLFSIVYNQTPLQNAKIGGILYMPAGGVKEKAERGEEKSKTEQEQAAYKMNGLLIQDPEIIRCMEPDGKGIYIPAKLKTGTSELDRRAGTYLTDSGFRSLYRYVMNTLKQTAQHIYHGDIDANPLITQKRNSCQYCGYQDICGNLQQQPCRSVTGSASEAKEQMLEILRQMEEEES
jgi:ATP-dependent helicase/nuclease subunit B